jgi:hypothetical protein
MKTRNIWAALVALALGLGGTVALAMPANAEEAAPDAVTVAVEEAAPIEEIAATVTPLIKQIKLTEEPAAIEIITPAKATPSTPAQTYTLTAWAMPSWINDRTATWPQDYQTSVVQTIPAINALDSSLPCGSQFQVDVYLTGDVTTALIAGGKLYGPNNPREALIRGGWGVAYKVMQTAACPPEPVVEQHEESACSSSSEYTTRTWITTDGVVSNEASSTRTIDRAEAIALACYTPPVIECEAGTLPGWLNEFGDATSCVSNNPCPEVEPGQPCPGDVPPAVTPPTEATPDATPVVNVTPAKSLAYTGSDAQQILGGIVVGGLGLALGITLIVVSAIRRRASLEV